MRNRKHIAWRKNRKFGDVHGGRSRPKLADNIFNRKHSLKAPGVGAVTPICIEDNPSRDWFFPLGMDECLEALRALPERDFEGITHVWLRRPSGVDRRRGVPLAEFICGSGVRLIVFYPWRADRRICLGRSRPAGKRAQLYERFGAGFVRERGWWYAEFDAESLRRFCVNTLYHEVGHHVDWYVRHWSKANGKQVEDAADDYAVRFAREGEAVLSRLPGPRAGTPR